jgi:hypothetical protein
LCSSDEVIMNAEPANSIGPWACRGALPGNADRDAQSETDATPPDEAALANILRLLNQIRARGVVSPVDRAFVLAARTMFDELAGVCARLLEGPAPPTPTPQPEAAATRAESTEEAAPKRASSAKKKLTPGGATAQ